MIINFLRKNIGIIIAGLGFFILCILTFGNIGEIVTEDYWQNVLENLTAIGFMSIALTLIQVAIKQGLSEQALQRGLNTDNTTTKYQEHKNLIKSCTDKMIYMPYFLQSYNERHTILRKREFLVNNNFSSEKALMLSGKKRLIRHYNNIQVYITTNHIKWATTEIVHDKKGRIATLNEYRCKRLVNSIVLALCLMIGTAFLTRGLFFEGSGEPLYAKFIKLFTYMIVIAIGSILGMVKDYEKGAFAVPNELDEINEIWQEFKNWEVPAWVIDDFNMMNEHKWSIKKQSLEELENEECIIDRGTDLSTEQEKT